MSKLINIDGNKFGRLTVLKYVGNMRWECRCECGKLHVTSRQHLINGHTKSCGCARYNRILHASFLAYYRSIIIRADNRNIEFKLSKEHVLKMSGQLCFYCGIEPFNVRKTRSKNRGHFIYNGIDRVDSALGYIEGNVVPCCSICNVAKHEMSYDEFLTWIDRIYLNLKKLRNQ